MNSSISRESMPRAYGLNAKMCYVGVDTGVFVDHQRSRETLVMGFGAIFFAKDFVRIGNVSIDRLEQELGRVSSDRHAET